MGQLSVATVTRLVIEMGSYRKAARQLGMHGERVRRICQKRGVVSKRTGRKARFIAEARKIIIARAS